MMKMMKSIKLLLACALLGAGMTGCAGYRVGSTLPHDVRTVYVPTFINRTVEPQIEVAATDATIARIQFDGSMYIVQKDNADATLEVVLTSYRIDPISYDNKDTVKATEYRALLTAAVLLKRNSNNETIVRADNIIGETTFTVTGDMSNSKRNALPALTEDLGRRIVDQIVEVW
jgi:hypothetical protein